jgi:pimeloyl-ACP methyl ester carboxylesterase
MAGVSGLDVVLVHGVRTSRTIWREHVAALGRAGVSALALDLPGHGARRGERFTVEAACAAIDDGVRQSSGPVVLVGHSLGGYMAGEYASRYPDRVALAVLSGCSTTPAGPLAWMFRRASALIARFPARGARADRAVQCLVLRPGFRADVAAGGLAYEAMPAAIKAVCALRPMASLARIDTPIWLVNGRWDHFRLGERRLVRRLRDARTVIVRGAGHLVPMDQPDTYIQILLAAHREATQHLAT